MMIAELKDEATGRSVVAAIVGSCRVYEPLGSLHRSGFFKILWNRFTPFTYDVEETYQYLCYCLGKLEIPAELRAFTYNGEATPTPKKDFAELIPKVELVIAEVSSLTSMSCREFYLDHNMIGTKFIRGRGKLYLDWWRDLIAGRDVAEHVAKIIQDHAERKIQLGGWHENILRDARLVQYNEQTLSEPLRRLCGSFDKPWMFISHFQFSNQPEQIRPERAALLKTLQIVAGAQGHRVFDPSPTVISNGRETSLAGNGVDQFHYAVEFKPIIGAAIAKAALSDV